MGAKLSTVCSKSEFTSHDTSDKTEFSLLISQIRKEFEKSDTVNIDRVNSILGNYKSNPSEWKKYVTWDPHRYTRNLVDEGNGKYNLIILCWSESQVTPVHNHPNSTCFIKVLSGQLLETVFALPPADGKGKQLQVLKEIEVKRDEVSYIDDSIGLHSIENPSHSEGLVTLHLYVPPFKESGVYDIRSGKKSIGEMKFTTKGGVPVTH